MQALYQKCPSSCWPRNKDNDLIFVWLVANESRDSSLADLNCDETFRHTDILLQRHSNKRATQTSKTVADMFYASSAMFAPQRPRYVPPCAKRPWFWLEKSGRRLGLTVFDCPKQSQTWIGGSIADVSTTSWSLWAPSLLHANGRNARLQMVWWLQVFHVALPWAPVPFTSQRTACRNNTIASSWRFTWGTDALRAHFWRARKVTAEMYNDSRITPHKLCQTPRKCQYKRLSAWLSAWEKLS